MRLEKYINQLLFQHDCVIVPKFGAFISHPTSATINAEDSSITPPHHAISFNSALTTNDGIIEQAYEIGEAIDREEASLLLEDDVNNWKTRIENGENIHLKKVGFLKKDQDGNLKFEPHTTLNLLPDAFGLTTIHPNLILPIEPEEKNITEAKKNWSSILAVASVIPIIVGGYFYFNTPQPVQKFVDHQWSGIVIPAIKEAAPNLLNSNQINKADTLKDVIHNLPTTIVDPLEYVQTGTSISLPAQEHIDSAGNSILSKYEITVVEEKQLNDTEKEVKAIIRNSTNDTKEVAANSPKKEDKNSINNSDKKVDEVVKTDTNPKKFQVIAASLRRADDAARMLRSLENEGYKNASVVYVKGRFYYVNFDSFDTMDKASTFLNKLHSKHPDAWIREHK